MSYLIEKRRRKTDEEGRAHKNKTRGGKGQVKIRQGRMTRGQSKREVKIELPSQLINFGRSR
jgi:hypothetical protein